VKQIEAAEGEQEGRGADPARKRKNQKNPNKE